MENIENKIKYCSFACLKAVPQKDIPACMTANPIYCKKYKEVVTKGDVCLYYARREKHTKH